MGNAGGSKHRARTILQAILLPGLIVIACLAFIIGSDYINGYTRGSRPAPGDFAKYDAFAVYPQIAQFAGSGVQLLRIDLNFVKSDGTLDLTADYGASVTYTFARILDTPTSSAPLGAGVKSGVPNVERIYVKVEKVGVQGIGRNRYYNFGMTPSYGKPTPLTDSIIDTPTCNLKDLWDAAIKVDAPASAVATIRYDSNGYAFSIDSTKIYLRFGSDCQLKK